MELPFTDGYVEARTCARSGQLRGAEAGGADADVDHGADGAHQGHYASRCCQRRHRLRCRGGRGSRRVSGSMTSNLVTSIFFPFFFLFMLVFLLQLFH